MYLNDNNKTEKIISYLFSCLESRISPTSLSWLNNKKTEINCLASERIFFTSYSAVPRYLESQKINLDPEELHSAAKLVPGWNLTNWTFDRIGRAIILLSLPSKDLDLYVATLDKIISAADLNEAIAFYQSLPLLPHPEKFQLQAAEGVRSNMTVVFNAVALYNPYPAEYFNDLAWNQMVLKALFIDSPLYPIYGLERRNNRQLCQMLVDYASERLSANRAVSSELWKLVLPFQPEAVARLTTESSEVLANLNSI